MDKKTGEISDGDRRGRETRNLSHESLYNNLPPRITLLFLIVMVIHRIGACCFLRHGVSLEGSKMRSRCDRIAIIMI